MSMKMIPSKSKKGAGDSMDTIYSRSMYRREICVGTVGHSSPSNPIHVEAPANSIPLDARVQRSSLRTSMRWDWQKGQYVREPMNLLDSSRSQINHLKIRTVTSGRNEPEDRMANVYGTVGMAATPVVRAKKSSIKSGKKRKG